MGVIVPVCDTQGGMVRAIPRHAGAVALFNLGDEGMAQTMRMRGEAELPRLTKDTVKDIGAMRRDLHRFHGIRSQTPRNS